MSADNDDEDHPENPEGHRKPAEPPDNSPLIGQVAAVHGLSGETHAKRARSKQGYYDHELIAAKLRQGWAKFCSTSVWGWSRSSANGVIAVLTVALIVTSYLQTQKQGEQVGEMVKQTAALIETNRIANTQRDEMAKQTWAMIGTNLISVGQLLSSEQNRAILEQNDLARGQLGIAQGQLQQLQLEQRAWLSSIDANIENLGADKFFRASIPIRNTGQTPGMVEFFAFDASIHWTKDGKNVESGETIGDAMKRFETEVTAGLEKHRRKIVLPPDATTALVVSRQITTLKADYDGVMGGDRKLFVYGVFAYDDVFMLKQHKTAFCLVYDGAAKTMRTYELHNYMD